MAFLLADRNADAPTGANVGLDLHDDLLSFSAGRAPEPATRQTELHQQPSCLADGNAQATAAADTGPDLHGRILLSLDIHRGREKGGLITA
jgi:hypothetical protein